MAATSASRVDAGGGAELVPERLTADAFAPFGHTLDRPKDREPELKGERSAGWLMPFDAAGDPAVLTLWTRYGPQTVDAIERHDAVTQTFVCVSGAPAVLVVAPGLDRRGRSEPPALDDLRAFVVNPGQGFVLDRGAWHAPDRLPLREPGTAFVCFSDTQTTLAEWPADGGYCGTQVESTDDLWGLQPRIARSR
jgi:ureidoglycolate hydrolase